MQQQFVEAVSFQRLTLTGCVPALAYALQGQTKEDNGPTAPIIGEKYGNPQYNITFLTDRTQVNNGKEEPVIISQWVGATFGKQSTLRKWVQGMLGMTLNEKQEAKFNVTKLFELSAPCQLVLELNDNGYSRIASIIPLDPGQKAPTWVKVDPRRLKWIKDIVAKGLGMSKPSDPSNPNAAAVVQQAMVQGTQPAPDNDPKNVTLAQAMGMMESM